jgi:hypothetical protein
MQQDVYSYYLRARWQCLQRIEHILIWVTVTGLVAAAGVYALNPNAALQMMIIAAYVYLWLPFVLGVIVVNLLAWLIYNFKLFTMGSAGGRM